MKNCQTCGASLEDTSSFCVMCGAKIEGGVQNDLQVPPTVNQINYDSVMLGEKAAISPREMFFKAVSSGKALAAVILICIAYAVSLINIGFVIVLVSSGNLWAQVLSEMPSFNSLDTALIGSAFSIVSAVINIILILILIPATLNMLAILFIYLDGKKRSIKTRGLTLLAVTNIITLVLYGLTALLMLIAFSESAALMIAAFIGIIIGLGPFVAVQICFIITINKMKKVVLSDLNLSISTFVPVIIIIFSGIMALFNLSSGNFISILFSLIGITGNIMLAVCMFDYNNKIALMRVQNMYNKNTNTGNGL